MKLLVIGTGYVGLVTGACFAEVGHKVLCLDIDEEKVARLRKGIVPIYEPRLEELVRKHLHSQRLHFTTHYDEGMAFTSMCILALPTPTKASGECDLSHLLEALTRIASSMQESKVFINKSTVPVGTADNARGLLERILKSRGVPFTVDFISSPEFLKEGEAVNDCLYPDRLLFGVDTSQAEALMRTLYAPFRLDPEQIIVMDPRSAEMTKYAANGMLATRISFMNEIAGLCELVGADIQAIRRGMGVDPRIGPHFLCAGAGYGGSCFPKDIKAFQATAACLGYRLSLLETVEEVNERQKRRFADKIRDYFHNQLQGKVIALWGLAFKPGTDDMREAPSLAVIESLLHAGACLRLFDPVAMDNAKQLLDHPCLTWCDQALDTAAGADAIALLTEWTQFRAVDLLEIKRIMRGRAFFDGRNQYLPQEMAALGFDYIAIGRPKALASPQIQEPLLPLFAEKEG